MQWYVDMWNHIDDEDDNDDNDDDDDDDDDTLILQNIWPMGGVNTYFLARLIHHGTTATTTSLSINKSYA